MEASVKDPVVEPALYLILFLDLTYGPRLVVTYDRRLSLLITVLRVGLMLLSNHDAKLRLEFVPLQLFPYTRKPLSLKT